MKLVQRHALIFKKFAHQGANFGAFLFRKLDRVGDTIEISSKDFFIYIPKTIAVHQFFVCDGIISRMARHLRWREDCMDPVKYSLQQLLEASVFDVIAHGDKVIDLYFQQGDQSSEMLVFVGLVNLFQHFFFKLVRQEIM